MAKKEEAMNNIDGFYENILKSYRNAYYKTLITFVCLTIFLFINGLVLPKVLSMDEAALPLYLISAFFNYMFYIVSILLISIAQVARIEERSKVVTSYSKSSEFIKKIFIEEGIEKNVKVEVIDDTNVGICESDNGDKIIVSIGTYILKFFTLDEIRSILYHEIAHYKNRDTFASKIKNKYLRRLSFFLPYEVYQFYCPRLGIIHHNNSVIEAVGNIVFENKADDAVLSKNLNKEYASSAIKLFGLSYAYRLARGRIDYLLSKEKKWTKEIIEEYYQAYLDFFLKNKERFIFISKNHLEGRAQTHPNVKQRVDKFACGEVEVDMVESHLFDEDIEEFYARATEHVLLHTRDEYFEHQIKSYEEYLDRLNKAKETNYEVPAEELVYLCNNTYSNGDYDEAKIIASKILAIRKDNTRSRLILGLIYAFIDFSDECLPYLEAVYEEKNSFFNRDSFEALGEYYTITGKTEKRDALREETGKNIDDSGDMDKVMTLLPTDKVEKYDDKEVIDKIISLVSDEEKIMRVSIVTKKVNNFSCNHVILFISPKTKSFDEIKEAYNNVWAYLDVKDGDEQFNLMYVNVLSIPLDHPFKREHTKYLR